MPNVDKTIIEYIRLLTDLHSTCDNFKKEANVDNGEKILEKVDKCERMLLKLREDLAIMIQSEDEKNKFITAIQTEKGLLVQRNN